MFVAFCRLIDLAERNEICANKYARFYYGEIYTYGACVRVCTRVGIIPSSRIFSEGYLCVVRGKPNFMKLLFDGRTRARAWIFPRDARCSLANSMIDSACPIRQLRDPSFKTSASSSLDTGGFEMKPGAFSGPPRSRKRLAGESGTGAGHAASQLEISNMMKPGVFSRKYARGEANGREPEGSVRGIRIQS